MHGIDHIHPKLLHCITRILTTETSHSFYGEFSLYVVFKKTEQVPTAGVTFKANGEMWYYYNEKYLDSLTENEVTFLHYHELFHLLCNHVSRSIGYEPKLSNIVQDMIINTCLVKDFTNTSITPIKFKEGKNAGKTSCYFVPVEYKGSLIFEELYDWMKEQKEKMGKGEPGGSSPGKGDGESDPDGDGEGEIPENDGKIGPDGVSDYTRNAIKNAENYVFDIHFESEISDELKEQYIKDIVNGLKARGTNTAHIEGILKKLCPPKVNYMKQIALGINHLKGTEKTETIAKPNRRGIVGVKGRKMVSKTLACILDVSGSMSGELETVLSYIFINGYYVELILCDTEVKKHVTTHCKNDIQKVNIVGYGGTVLQPSIDYVVENLNHCSLIVLTDGVTDSLDFSRIKNKVLVITCQREPDYQTNGKTRVITIPNLSKTKS